MKLITCLLFLLLIYTNVSTAQSIIGIEPSFRFGKVFRHTINFKPVIQTTSPSFDLNLTWQTTGNKEWQRLHDYPFLGLAVGYTEFGNANVLGSAVYLVPNINLPLATGKKLQLYLKVGVGLAYLNKHYNRLTNPTNNVIASALNNCTAFSLRLRYKINDHFKVFVGSSFSHFSVGDVKIPNLGINVPTGDVGINYTFKPVTESTFNHGPLNPAIRRIIFGVNIGVGFNSVAAPDGPTYPIYIAEVQVGKYAGRWNKFSIGSQIDYNVKNYYYLRNQEIDEGSQKSKSTDYAALVKDEMIFGNYSISLQVAYYLQNALLTGSGLYEKLGAHYCFLRFGKNKHMGLAWGVLLSTHFFNADYVSTEIGFSF